MLSCLDLWYCVYFWFWLHFLNFVTLHIYMFALVQWEFCYWAIRMWGAWMSTCNWFLVDGTSDSPMWMSPCTALCGGSGTARHGQCCMAHLLQDVVALNPHIIFVHVGENDLPPESPSSLCSLYCDLLQRLSSIYHVILWASCYHSRAVHVTTRWWLLPTNGWLMYPVIQVSSGAIAVCFSSLLLPGSSYQTAFIWMTLETTRITRQNYSTP